MISRNIFKTTQPLKFRGSTTNDVRGMMTDGGKRASRSHDFGQKAAQLTEAWAGGFLGMAPVSNYSL